MASGGGHDGPINAPHDRIDDLLVRFGASATTSQASPSHRGNRSHAGRSANQSLGSPAHHVVEGGAASLDPYKEGATMNEWVASKPGRTEGEVNYPTSAVEILDLLKEGVAILSGGRDKQGQSLITFPSQPKGYVYQRDSMRRVVQYLACIPTVDVRESGFSVIIDARNISWSNTKLILRTLQEALPGQIHVAYILQPGQFWQKQQSRRGHSKEKAKLEFTTIKLSAVEKLTRHVDGSQLTEDLGGFLPYNHTQWLSLRQDLEHFISLFSGLMEHSNHIEQQIRMEQEKSESETVEDQLKHHHLLQDMVKRAPHDAIRKGNELLKTLERSRDESGSAAITPDKINAITGINLLLEKISQRQAQLEALWRERKIAMEQAIQLKGFERAMQKVKSWLKTRGEEMVSVHNDIGSSLETVQAVLEHHEKNEAKAKLQYNLLTQLRRSTDRYSGEDHFAAENMQKQVSKLSAKFTRFESKMATRKKIIETSVRLHTSLRQWKEQCGVVAKVLKQEGGAGAEAESHEELVCQLRDVGDVVLEEAGLLMEYMIVASRRSSEAGGEGSSGRGSAPDYSTGMSHVRRVTEEIEKHRVKLGQLAEARKIQTEQLRQIDSCEKDAKQETRWLEYMRSQLSTTHGDIGVSVASVDKLTAEHDKFIETAKKSYKYGCGLISAAEKSRRSFQLESETSSALFSSHTSMWERLSSGSTEVGERLSIARHFHTLMEEVLFSFGEWLQPLHELPKTPQLVEERLTNMADNRDHLFKKAQECLDTGHSLFDRLSRPVLPEPEFMTLNERVKGSHEYLHERLEGLEKKAREVEAVLPQQEQLLREFIKYCQFEKRIERILLWLQRHGLKKLPTFSLIGDSEASITKQLTDYETFRLEANSLSLEVDQLLATAEEVEAEIVGFRSDLKKKTDSLKGVWFKFLQRVENRGTVLNTALAFHISIEQIHGRVSHLSSALSPQAVAKGGGRPYLNELIPSKRELEELYGHVTRDGRSLMEIFNTPPVNPSDNTMIKISAQLSRLEGEKKEIASKWEEAWKLSEKLRGNLIGRSPGVGGQSEAPPTGAGLELSRSKSNGSDIEGVTTSRVHAVSKNEVKKVGQVTRRDSDKYSELEEEAYEYLGWIESEYDDFMATHSHFHDSPDGALSTKDEYDSILDKLEPTCRKTERVLELLSQLRPQAPLLAPSIDKLQQVVSEQVNKRKNMLRRCSDALQTYVQFCLLYKELDEKFQSLEDSLCEDFPADVAMDTAQDLLEEGQLLIKKIKEEYEKAKSLGETFLSVTSELLCSRGGPKLSVGGACTSVAVDLGDLEGRCPDILEQWGKREKELGEIVDWQAFKLASDQICSWLRESAELFLQNHTDIGTSSETAEDLITEHQEFQMRAKRTATEVSSLLVKSGAMLGAGHPNAAEIRDLTSDLRSLHTHFESRFEERKKLLESTFDFYNVSYELQSDMTRAIEKCKEYGGTDLPGILKITSISSRLTNLQHQGHLLTVNLANKPSGNQSPRRTKTFKRSDSTSASEVAIQETLSSLEREFTSYKAYFENRRLSPIPPHATSQKSVSPVSPTFLETRANLKSPTTAHSPWKKSGSLGEEFQNGQSVVRSNTVGGVHSKEGGEWGVARKRAATTVKLKVAALNEKSREDMVPIQEMGTSFGTPTTTTSGTSAATRHRAATSGDTTTTTTTSGDRDITNISGDNDATSSTIEPAPPCKPGVSDVPSSPPGDVVVEEASAVVRRKSKTRGLSKAERTRKIEDIKKLFETSEINDLTSTSNESDQHVWTPRTFGRVKSPVNDVKMVSNNIKIASGGVKIISGSDVKIESDDVKIESKKIKSDDFKIESDDVKIESNDVENEDIDPVFLSSPPPPVVLSPPPSIVLSPPPETRVRLNTAPTIIRTIIKDHVPDKKQIITISLESKPHLPQPGPTKNADSTDRVTRSISPQNLHRVNSDPYRDPALRGKTKDALKGKVSSLRSMFDSQSRPRANTDSNLEHHRQSKGVRPPVVTISNDLQPIDTTIDEKPQDEISDAPQEEIITAPQNDILNAPQIEIEIQGEVSINIPDETLPPQSEVQAPPDICPPEEEPKEQKDLVTTSKDEEIEALLAVPHPPRPRLPSPSVLSPSPHHTPPPRPPPPLGYYDKLSSTPEVVTGSDTESLSSSSSEFGSSLLNDSDLESLENEEWEWNSESEDEDVDGEGQGRFFSGKSRPLRSLRQVLLDIVACESSHHDSLAVMVSSYIPLLASSSPHTPSYLQGTAGKIFANCNELYNFQRKFFVSISSYEDSLEGICNLFVESEEELKHCYIPFLLNLERGLKILNSYGGTFITDKEREIGDDVGLKSRLVHPMQRLVVCLEQLKDMLYCAQKQYLHGVSLVKSAIQVMVSVLRAVDNAISLSKLQGCPQDIMDGGLICRNHFLVYSTREKKRRIHRMIAYLHPHKVVLARPHREKRKRKEGEYEFYEALEMSTMHLLETYKTEEDKFALCEGSLRPDNLFVMQSAYHTPMLIKCVWLQEMRPILQQRDTSRGILVEERDMPLPIFFQPVRASLPAQHNYEEAGLKKAPSLRKRLSIRKHRRGAGSGRIKGEESGEINNLLMNSGELDRRGRVVRSSTISSVSSSSSVPVVTSVHLASMTSEGSFQIQEQPQHEDDLYEAVKDYISQIDDFSVRKGQKVEVLDSSEVEEWLVLTLPRYQGDVQMEGFIPPHYLCLRQSRSHTPSLTSSEVEEIQNEQFEAETGQEVPQGRHDNKTPENKKVEPLGSQDDTDLPYQTLTFKPVDPVCSEETTGQDLSSPKLLPLHPPKQIQEEEEEQSSVTDDDVVSSSSSDQTPPPSYDEIERVSSSPSPEVTEPHPSSLPPPYADLLATEEEEEEEEEEEGEGEAGETSSSEERDVSGSPPSVVMPEGEGEGTRGYRLGGDPLSSSLQSLPTTFSPAATPTMAAHKFLGYNPMMIPTLTLSQPNIPHIKMDPSCPPHHHEARQRGELSQLQWATVKATLEASLEDFDPVEIYIAIVDFVAVEESNISLTGGQCVQVLDDSRSDWWLVMSTDEEGCQGWVPANYLEKKVIEGPLSPPPEPFEDEAGELAHLMRKEQTASELNLNRRELYDAPFLATPTGERIAEEPSEAQLQGMFSIQIPYITLADVQGTYPQQISVIQNQPVKVLDSKRSDWWLVSTMPDEDEEEEEEEEEHPVPVEGWIRASLLQPCQDIMEDNLDTSIATETTDREEEIMMRSNSLGLHASVSPSGPAQWVVLADYTATELGMLSVNEGEMVEVIDTSRNEWCLVKPMSRPSEGWVPTAYLSPYGNERYTPLNHTSPRFRSLSPSEESDTSTEISERGVPLSPELLETCDDEEQRAYAEERRSYIISELSKTEQDYVQKLHYCLMNYDPDTTDGNAPGALRALRNTLFGNLGEIYLFHKNKFLPRLMESEADPSDLGDAFVHYEEDLRLYVSYCQNKASSDDIYHEFFNYFETLRMELKDRQKLPDYLILPVQRITKYGLLLSDFQKYSIKASLPSGRIDQGLEVTRNISTQANNAIHLSLIEGGATMTDKLGDLVFQDVFLSQETHRQVSKERRVFLFERALVITKRRRKEEVEVYNIKEQLMLHDVSMIQDMDPEKINIIIYDMITGTKYLLTASKTSIRDTWLAKSSSLIHQAKKEASDLRSRSSSEPVEFVRSQSFSRKSFWKDKEGSKRKMRRPNSSSSMSRGSSRASTEERVAIGTEYVVMECIVLEGEDDLTLEPGEMVELVREALEDTPLLRVRTMDENKLEGSIPSSYLRKRDSIKGTEMESTPKFTMHPVDLDLPVGSIATISCAFNGYPAPSVMWRRDHEILTSDVRRKITSCNTSSVLEITKLEYDDEGRYSCCITNSMATDSTTMTLTLHGPPSEPQKPIVSKITGTSVKLKWAVPDMDGGVPILSYQIEMLQDRFDKWQPIVQQPRTYFVVKILEPSTSYQFRVSAVNEYGFSTPSEATDVVVTKGRGGLLNSSPSFKKPKISAQVSQDEVKDYHDDDFGSEQLSFIRRGSVSSAYDIIPEELGRGRFGIVHTCLHRQTGVQYAAKFVRLRSRRKQAIRKEVEMLQRVRGKSPYILEFQDAFERGRNLIIVTELVPSNELLETVVAENNLTEAVAVGYVSQLLSGVDTLHKIRIAHLDIRPENILLSFGRVKLIDFGTARDMSVSDSSPLLASSVEFCAPEIILQDTPTVSADMWSLGVLTYVLLSGLSPFFADNIQAVVLRIQEARYSFYNEQFDAISQEAKDFISSLLQKSPDYRTTACNALEHPWVTTLGRVSGRSSSPWPMAKLDISQLKSFIARRKWHTSSVAVDDTTVYGPRSMTCFSPTPPDFEERAKIEEPPRLLDGLEDVNGRAGLSITLQFQVSGCPIPSVTWEHEGRGEVTMSLRRRVVELSGGTTSLTISELTSDDEGVYVCSAVNSIGSVSATTKLTILVVPSAPTDVNTIILGSYNSALISWLPPAANGNASISNYRLERQRLEFEKWEEVSHDIEGAAHVVDDLLPGVAYIFRVSAINEVGTGPASEPSEPVTIETSLEYDSESPTHERSRIKTSAFELEYKIEEEIWRGKFTSVVKCTEVTTDYTFAAKIMDIEGCDEDARDKALGELEMLRELTHPRLVTLEDSFDNENRIILVMEYLAGGTLSDYVISRVNLTEYKTTRLMSKIMEGLQFLHEAKIIHVNLTPDNILLTSSYGDLRIGGFGLARYIETGNQLTSLDGCRLEFLSPEAAHLQPLTTGADIWSVGTVACHMVTGESPFLRDSHEAMLSLLTSSSSSSSSSSLDLTGKLYSPLSPECRDFIALTLTRNPRRRLTAQQCQHHRWLLGSPQGKRRGSQGSPAITRKVSLERKGSLNSPSRNRKRSSDNSPR